MVWKGESSLQTNATAFTRLWERGEVSGWVDEESDGSDGVVGLGGGGS